MVKRGRLRTSRAPARVAVPLGLRQVEAVDLHQELPEPDVERRLRPAHLLEGPGRVLSLHDEYLHRSLRCLLDEDALPVHSLTPAGGIELLAPRAAKLRHGLPPGLVFSGGICIAIAITGIRPASS